jgi:glutamyl-Q tRNA(Asp) synthetase
MARQACVSQGAMSFVTRFAPSPTGDLHLGHAFAAMTAEAWARLSGGTFLLRIDDLDMARSRPEFEHGIYEDLIWLGLRFAPEVRRQSDCMGEYAAALEQLRALGVLYRCFCTRAEIQAELAAMAGAPQGPEGPLYPGTCRGLARIPSLALGTSPTRGEDDVTQAFAWRIDVEMAARVARVDGGTLGDVVLARKDTPASYHLAVVVDDAATCVTLVTRGDDLESATGLHVLLQRLLGLPTPQYAHHRLITDEFGKRLAKRDKARSLRQLRADGATPEDVRRLVNWGEMEAEIKARVRLPGLKIIPTSGA